MNETIIARFASTTRSFESCRAIRARHHTRGRSGGRSILARPADTGRPAGAYPRAQGRGRRRWTPPRTRGRRPLAGPGGRRPPLRREGARRGELRRPPVRPLGRAARRRARDHARRSRERVGAALGAAAQGRRPDALLAQRRRPRGAALVDPRVPLQRGDAPPRRADDARAEPGGDRRAGRARHVLRRPPALEPGAIVCRVAPSFIRFGNFELPARAATSRCSSSWSTSRSAATSPSSRRPAPPTGACAPNGSREVCERTARMVATGCASASCTA